MKVSAKIILLLLSVVFFSSAQEGKIEIFEPELTTTPHLLCICTGSANLLNGTLLQLSWKRVVPGGETSIAQWYAMVENKHFRATIGPFTKNIYPGIYRLVAFCSPGLQPVVGFNSMALGCNGCVANEKLRWAELAKIGFVKGTLLFTTGNQRYRSVFEQEYRWMDKFLPQVERCFAKSRHDYRQAKIHGDLDRWLLGSVEREKRIDALQSELENRYSNYLQAFFPGSYRDLNALLNLVEMFHYTAEISLRGEGEQFLQQRLRQFEHRYPESIRRFHYNAIAMAPKNRQLPLLLSEIHTLTLLCQEKSAIGAENELDIGRLRQSAIYLVRLRYCKRRLSYFPKTILPFVKISNTWLVELKKILSEMEEDALPAEKKAIFYRLALALLGNWSAQIQKLGVDVDLDQTDFPNFDKHWKKATASYREQDLLNASVKIEMVWIEQKLAEVRKELKKRNFSFNWQRKIHELEAQLISRQKLNCQLASLHGNAPLLVEYLCLCAYTIDFFELAGEYCEGNINFDAVKNSLNKINTQMELLKKMAHMGN